MSVYLIVYGVLIACWIINLFSNYKNLERVLYYFCFIVLWLFLVFRYAQGSDYFGYKYIFFGLNNFEEAINNPYNRHSEIGFRLLCALFGERYELFVAAIGSFNMLMIHRCIKRYSDDWLLSMIVFFPTYYLTYFFSALRQGIVFAVFVGVMLECLEKRRMKSYYLLCVLICTIHSVSILYAVIPVILKLKQRVKSKGGFLYFPLLAIGFGCVLALLGYDFFLKVPILGSKIAPYLDDDISWMGLTERVVSYYVVTILYFSLCKTEHSKQLDMWMTIYCIGAVVYFACFPAATISSRGCMLFKGIEMLLLVKLVKKRTYLRQLAVLYIVSLSALMTFKNINSYIIQANYNENVTVLNYPYFTIFHEYDDVSSYRSDDEHYEWLVKNGYE